VKEISRTLRILGVSKFAADLTVHPSLSLRIQDSAFSPRLSLALSGTSESRAPIKNDPLTWDAFGAIVLRTD